jgi:excisionase family DNA binding protein
MLRDFQAPLAAWKSRDETDVDTATAFERTLTSNEAAQLLKIHPKTLQRMARKGQIPAHRIGDLWRFRASELDTWFRSRVVEPNRHSCRD